MAALAPQEVACITSLLALPPSSTLAALWAALDAVFQRDTDSQRRGSVALMVLLASQVLVEQERCIALCALCGLAQAASEATAVLQVVSYVANGGLSRVSVTEGTAPT